MLCIKKLLTGVDVPLCCMELHVRGIRTAMQSYVNFMAYHPQLRAKPGLWLIDQDRFPSQCD